MIPAKYHIGRILSAETRTTLAIQQSTIIAASKAVSVLVSLMYVPLLLSYLEAERYGVWLTLLSMMNWIEVFDVGLGNGVRNKLVGALAKKDQELARIYISTGYTILVLIFLPIAAVSLLLSHFVNWSRVFNTSLITHSELIVLVNIVILCICLRSVVKLIGAIFKAFQLPSVEAIVIALSGLLSFGFVYLLTRMPSEGLNLSLMALGVSGIPVLVYVIFSLYTFRTRLAYLRPRFRDIDFHYSGPLLRLGSRFFVVQTARAVIFASSNLLITHLYGTAEVVLYNIAVKLFSLPVLLYSLVLSPMWSATTDAYEKGDLSWIRKSLTRLNRASFALVGLIGLLVLGSTKIYLVWLGGEVAIPWRLTLAVAGFSAVFVLNAPYSALVNGFGKLKLTTRTSIGNVAAFFLCAYLLSRVLDGCYAIAISMMVTNFLGFSVRYLQVQKVLNRSATGIWAE